MVTFPDIEAPRAPAASVRRNGNHTAGWFRMNIAPSSQLRGPSLAACPRPDGIVAAANLRPASRPLSFSQTPSRNHPSASDPRDGVIVGTRVSHQRPRLANRGEDRSLQALAESPAVSGVNTYLTVGSDTSGCQEIRDSGCPPHERMPMAEMAPC